MAARSESFEGGRERGVVVGRVYKKRDELKKFIDYFYDLGFFEKYLRDWDFEGIKKYCQEQKISPESLIIKNIKNAHLGCDFIKYGEDKYYDVIDFFNIDGKNWSLKTEMRKDFNCVIQMLKNRQKFAARIFSENNLPQNSKIADLDNAKNGCDFIKYGENRYFDVRDFFEKKNKLIKNKESEFKNILAIIEYIRDESQYFINDFQGKKSFTKDDNFISEDKKKRQKFRSEGALDKDDWLVLKNFSEEERVKTVIRVRTGELLQVVKETSL